MCPEECIVYGNMFDIIHVSGLLELVMSLTDKNRL